jgi:hypothetical protein
MKTLVTSQWDNNDFWSLMRYPLRFKVGEVVDYVVWDDVWEATHRQSLDLPTLVETWIKELNL